MGSIDEVREAGSELPAASAETQWLSTPPLPLLHRPSSPRQLRRRLPASEPRFGRRG